MNSSEKDYRKLYHLQDNFLQFWFDLKLPFYLTGGTALGRFYLEHRYSDDLDFFVNADPSYSDYIKNIRNAVVKEFNVDIQEAVFTEDYTRMFIKEGNISLKVEWINDVRFRYGKPLKYKYGLIDNPANILANKLTALVGRDEPKDIFDILELAEKFSFNWVDIFAASKEKSVINEIDVERQLLNFSINEFQSVNWLKKDINLNFLESKLKTIADDFLLGRNNSLGTDKQYIFSVKSVLLNE